MLKVNKKKENTLSMKSIICLIFLTKPIQVIQNSFKKKSKTKIKFLKFFIIFCILFENKLLISKYII